MEQIEVMDFSLCPKFEKGFQILGKKWNGLIIDVLLEGGPQRFCRYCCEDFRCQRPSVNRTTKRT